VETVRNLLNKIDWTLVLVNGGRIVVILWISTRVLRSALNQL